VAVDAGGGEVKRARFSSALTSSLKGLRQWGPRAALLGVTVAASAWLCLMPLVSCGSTVDNGGLQPADLALATDASAFDRNSILSNSDFDRSVNDPEQARAKIHDFFGRNPYGRQSFLRTYQSNGIEAADAYVRAGRTHRINPIILLVATQVLTGLVAETNYPRDPARIEFAFRCGCIDGKTCLVEYTGLDIQIDCLARNLRNAFNQASIVGASFGGWGKEKTSFTLDNVAVTPSNEATAAIYTQIPRVANESHGGTWAFWNIYQRYLLTGALSGFEAGLGEESSGTDMQVGEGCAQASECFSGPDTICASGYPGGLCTAPCDRSKKCPESGVCALFADGAKDGFCFRRCNPSGADCRQDYVCRSVKVLSDADASSATDFACVPAK